MAEYGSVLDGYIVPGEPLVSVDVITYNHGKYVRQCLDGILMQKVNFPYEVLVHDDASPDDTADIIREYEARFPTVIKPIYQTENQYSQGKSVSKFNIDRAKGKYIAQCEGDDYWTDPGKLQMQVDFLEEHEEYVGCAHEFSTINHYGFIISPGKNDSHNYTLTRDILRYYRLPGHTATLMYKNYFSKMNSNTRDDYYRLRGNGDWKLACLLLTYGPIYYTNRTMSAYRHVTICGTSYSATTQKRNLYAINYASIVDMTKFIEKHYHTRLHLEVIGFYFIMASVAKYLRHPNSENKSVLRSIREDNLNNPKFKKEIIKEILTNPISFIHTISEIYTMWMIYGRRSRRFAESIKMQTMRE